MYYALWFMLIEHSVCHEPIFVLIKKLSCYLSSYITDMDDIYENIEKYNPNKERKILIVFDDMIANMFTNKKFEQIVTELFVRYRN